jgi:hypothetical protein
MTAVPVPRNLAQDVATFVSTMVIIGHVARSHSRMAFAETNLRIADATMAGKRALRPITFLKP